MKWFASPFCAKAIFAGSGVDSLFEALRQGNEAEIRTAVRRGININSADKRGNTL